MNDYAGIEIGPIRPPSEAGSLFLRVSRNCPWNRCRFCALYKAHRFSRRPVEHVLRDIDLLAAQHGNGTREIPDPAVSGMVDRWMMVGGRTVFLQDADALGIGYDDLLRILLRIRELMPSVERITSYARSRTVLRLSPPQLADLRAAGLGRIHVGFESGSDAVLAFMQKGSTKAMHIEAGMRIKQAGIELSAYYMPGLGGRESLRENALETADLMRRVQPDYVRLRSLAIPDGAPLAVDVAAGAFSKADDVETMREILLFLEHVGDIPSRLVSDHSVNLLSGLSGNLATNREALMSLAEEFLSLEPGLQRLFTIGRRLGLFVRLEDMEISSRRAFVEAQCRRWGMTEKNVDALASELTRGFI